MKFITTDEGTAFMAALAIYEAGSQLDLVVKGLPKHEAAGHLYNYFREGPRYKERWIPDRLKRKFPDKAEDIISGKLDIDTVTGARPAHGGEYLEYRYESVSKWLNEERESEP